MDKEQILKEMPKVDLHVHLDGSVNPVLISSMTKIPLEEVKKQMSVNKSCRDLNEYLEKFSLPLSCMQTKKELEEITRQLLLDLKEENVIYAEIRFAPQLHTKKGLSQKEVVEAVTGVLEGHDEYSLILCLMRNGTFEQNKETIEIAKQFLGKKVCAIDLAGAEALYPTDEFSSLFSYAQKEGIPFTIHAGEASGIKSIESAIQMGASRLGHGVRAIESMQLIESLKQSQLPLEICPISNSQTHVFPLSISSPIYEFFKKGLCITINTDNRTVSNTTLTKEYLFLLKHFPFKVFDFKKINENAIKSSFMKEEKKAQYYCLLEQYWKDKF